MSSAATASLSGERPRVLIITGYGFNCEAESIAAWRLAGADPLPLHFADLLADAGALSGVRALMFIGGFSFGDHMGSGHVIAARLRHRLREQLQEFLAKGGLVLGICNGFQILARLGMVPAFDGDYFRPRVSLAMNDVGTFRNLWVRIRFNPASPCVFTQGLPPMDLPVRHGEGKLVAPDRRVLARIEKEHLAVCRYVDPDTGQPAHRYPANPNGSLNAIAGLCDPSGRVFGMMPHPEAYLYPEQHPSAVRQRLEGTLPAEGLGVAIFRNAVQYLLSTARAPAAAPA
ncbi:MAG: phosphoribosylformylglycinamidine synthase subunit PurQ [Kiritimatiellae bacterium]|nr:phosphoribosylformylglycinamidine synthase subunit PurQ [Kiritimatiellia bacterium]